MATGKYMMQCSWHCHRHWHAMEWTTGTASANAIGAMDLQCLGLGGSSYIDGIEWSQPARSLSLSLSLSHTHTHTHTHRGTGEGIAAQAILQWEGIKGSRPRMWSPPCRPSLHLSSSPSIHPSTQRGICQETPGIFSIPGLANVAVEAVAGRRQMRRGSSERQWIRKGPHCQFKGFRLSISNSAS